MPKQILKGSTNESVIIRIIDSTDGTPEQAVEHDSSGIAMWYRRELATKTTITPAALAALTTAHADGGIEHIDDGYYRFDIPDLAFATGVDSVMIGGFITGMVVIGVEVLLTDVDVEDAVRGGMTALPNAAAEAAGGLYTRGTGAGQINQAANGEIDVNITKISNVAQSLADLKDFVDDGYDPATNKVAGVLLVDTTTTNTDMVGTDGANTATPLTAAQVESKVNDALVALGLDHLVAVAVVGADILDDSIFAKIVSKEATADWDDFVNTTESLQAIRDRGDASWITGGGGGITDILNVMPIIPIIDLANTATVRIAFQLINSLDDLPATIEITPGTISIDRKAIGGTSWTNIVSDAAMSEAAGLVYYDEVFDAVSTYAAGDSIRITFKSQKLTVGANDYEITDATGVMYQTYIREAMRGTNGVVLAGPTKAEMDTAHGLLATESKQDAQDAIITEGRLAELDAANIPADIDAIPTTAMRGTDFAALASEVTAARMSELDDSSGKLVAIVDLVKIAADAIKLETDKLTLGDAGAGITGSIIEEIENIIASVAALNDITVSDVLTTQMTESYAANGVAPTLEQSQFAIHQMLMQFGIAGTSWTVRQLDNTTTAFIVTLDSATLPTDLKRV